MAWWKSGEGDDVTGDWPADILDAAHAALLNQAAEHAGSSPGLADLLRIWQDALNTEPVALLADAGHARYRLSALTTPATDEPALPNRTEAAAVPSDAALRKLALDALRQLSKAYRDAAERPPRVSELRRSLQSSLSNPAEDGQLREGPLLITRLEITP